MVGDAWFEYAKRPLEEVKEKSLLEMVKEIGR